MIPEAEGHLATVCTKDYLNRNRASVNHVVETVVTSLLATNNVTWAATPRLYIVLRILGLVHLRHHFFAAGHTDAHFPYSTFSLPKGVQDPERSSFLKAQTCILVGANQVSRWDLGEHVSFETTDHVPLEPKAILGTGGSGQVEIVVLRTSGSAAHVAFSNQLVRKRIQRRVWGRHQLGLKDFLNELKVLKRVHHRHLVEIIGSYTDPTFAALIMSPVADCDLAYFLKTATNDNHKLSSLRTFFGCLATALAYLHKVRIRHKDIKPPNILVHGANVLITDFGLSRDCTDTRSTTEGPTGRTPKYAAPEVVEYGPRSFSSDIWSLGCVYLEMLTVIGGLSLAQLSTFMLENGTRNTHYHDNKSAVEVWISQLRGGDEETADHEIFDWVQAMLMVDRNLRPSADTLAAEISNARSATGRVGEFCGICCRGSDEQFADVEMDDDTTQVPDSPLFEPECSDTKVIFSTEDLMDISAVSETEDVRALEISRDDGVTIVPMTPTSSLVRQETHNIPLRRSDLVITSEV